MFLAQIWFVDHQFVEHKGYERPCHWTSTSEEGSTASERLATFCVVTQLDWSRTGSWAHLSCFLVLSLILLMPAGLPHFCWGLTMLAFVEDNILFSPECPHRGYNIVITAHLISTRHFSAECMSLPALSISTVDMASCHSLLLLLQW